MKMTYHFYLGGVCLFLFECGLFCCLLSWSKSLLICIMLSVKFSLSFAQSLAVATESNLHFSKASGVTVSCCLISSSSYLNSAKVLWTNCFESSRKPMGQS